MGYTKEWWQKNRDRVLAQRRERYHTDAEHRDKLKKAAREYRRGVIRDVTRTGNRKREIVLDSGTIQGLTVQEFTEITGIADRTLRYYHRQNYLPPPLVSHPSRLYTPRQAQLARALRECLTANRTLMSKASPVRHEAKKELDDLVKIIHAEWGSL